MSRPAPMTPPRRSALPNLSAHGCASVGCRAFGRFGYGPPRGTSGPGLRWYCRDHRDQGEAWWAGITAAGGIPAGPGQGSLF